MLRLLLLSATLLATIPAVAQEPVGCDHFKFNVDKERALLNGSSIINVTSGATAPMPSTQAVALTLSPFTAAQLPMMPERPPKSDSSFAAFLHFAAPLRPGLYKVTLSDAAWIDVVQDGKFVKSTAFSGVLGCAGIRKSVIFSLGADPFTVEISGVKTSSIKLTVTAAQ
jgi:hypothetical protein